MPVFVAQQSKIKMVILTKNSIENAVWWSPIKQNDWNNERIIKGMLGRFENHPLCSLTNKIQFYENGVKIDEYTPVSK